MSRPARVGRWPAALLGSSNAARRLREDFARAARVSSRTLLVSAPGMDAVGIARAIHDRASAGAPSVEVNCAAGDAAAVESALLGRGSKRADGAIEQVDAAASLAVARGGTCVLIAVEELSHRAQGRLARVLRDGEVRIGSAGPVALNLRFVAIAGPSLDADVDHGHFRADLRRRLGLVRMDLPPLSERREDIGDILDGLMERAAVARGLAPRAFTKAAVALVAALQWPDNVVALAGLVDALAAQGEAPVRVEEVLAHLGAPGQNTIGPHTSLREARRQFEREYIAAVLRRYNGRIALAARALGIQRTNLYRKARQLGLQNGGRAS